MKVYTNPFFPEERDETPYNTFEFINDDGDKFRVEPSFNNKGLLISLVRHLGHDVINIQAKASNSIVLLPAEKPD